MANEYSFVSSISSRPQPLIDERTNRTDAVRGSEMSTLSQSSAPHRAGGDEESTGLPPGAEIPVPRGGSTRQLCPGTTVTPCRAMNDGLCTTLKSEKFDLLASLSRPLTWQPHKGKLKPFPESQYIRNAAGKPNRETRTGKAEFILMGNQKTMPEEESSVSKKHVLPGISGKKVSNNSRAAKASKSACGDMFIPREEPEVHGKEKTTIKAILELSLAIPLQFVDETATSDLKARVTQFWGRLISAQQCKKGSESMQTLNYFSSHLNSFS